MKRFFALAALVLGLAACQTEPEGLDVNVGGEVDTTITVSLPDSETRANSALGAFDNVVASDEYTIRYILQVYYNGEPSKERLVKYSDETYTTFDVRLVPGRHYNFVVWADVVKEADKTDLHYNTTNLHNITLKQTWVAMDETRDAFTGYFNTKEIDSNKPYNGKMSINIPLTRPFAKLRVITTDMVELGNLGIAPYKGTVTYTTKHRESFNACNGTYGAQTKEAVTLTYNIASYEDNDTQSKVVFTDYFFANDDVVKFTMDIMEADGSSIKFNNFSTDIPVKRNFLTTIEGNILTDGNNIKVDVNDEFTEIEWPNENETTEQLAYAAMFGGEVTLTEDVVLTQPLTIVEGANVVINLNGKTINAGLKQESRHHYAIDNYGTLTLKGNGFINARGVENFGTMTVDGDLTITNVDTNGGAAIWNEGELTINNGTFISSEGATSGSYGAALNTRAGGKAVVNNGTFKSYSHLTYAIINEGETTIYNANVEGKHGAVAGAETNDHTAIYGGTFKLNGNPDNSDHCTYYVSAIYGGTFSIVPDPAHGDSVFCGSTIATGYKVIEKNGKFVVVSNEVDAVVASKEDVQKALEDAATAGETEVVIDANGANINLDYGLNTTTVAAGTTVTIRNANVEGKSKNNYANGTVIFEDCTFNNASGAYSIHFDGGTGDVIFKNCKLYGWNSFAGTLNSVSFENCTLDGNGIYALIRSYANLTLTNCVINTSNAIHNDSWPEGIEIIAPATLTENNVTYVAENPEALKAALANGENVVLTQDITTEAATTAPYGNKYAFKLDGGVIDGNGHELHMECYGDDYGIMTSGGTIKNVTINEGCRAVMIMYPQTDVILDNVKIGGDGVLYPINTGEAGAEGVNLVVTNSVLAGWTSYGLIESATFTNVEFKQGTYYNNIYGRVLKPYVNTTLTNCSFVEHMNLDLSALNAGHKIVMKNCKVNGQAVTASVFTIPTTDAQYDTELFTIDLPSWASSINDCVVFE